MTDTQTVRCECHGEAQCPLLMGRCHGKVCAVQIPFSRFDFMS